MTTQIIRDTFGVITTGRFCQYGTLRKKDLKISCEGAQTSIVLTNDPYNILDLSTYGVAPTMDLYVNDKLVLSNTSQYVYDIGELGSEMRNIQYDHGFEVYGGCGNIIYISNISDEPLKFKIVYKTTGSYTDIYQELPKNYLIPKDEWFINDDYELSDNNTVNYNPDAGYLAFCLNPPENFEV